MKRGPDHTDFRRWFYSGAAPRFRDVGLFDYHHDGYRGSFNDPSSLPLGDRRLFSDAIIRRYTLREEAIRNIGYAVPCREALDAIADLGPLVEIGAGTGFWSALLARRGADIITTDRGRSTYRFRTGRYRKAEPVEGVRAVRRWPDRNVLMIWPCYDQSWAFEVANAMRPGRTLALVSEGQGGCVADDKLFQHLGDRWQHVRDVTIPTWSGMHDYLSIHRKRAAHRARLHNPQETRALVPAAPELEPEDDVDWNTGPQSDNYFAHSVYIAPERNW